MAVCPCSFPLCCFVCGLIHAFTFKTVQVDFLGDVISRSFLCRYDENRFNKCSRTWHIFTFKWMIRERPVVYKDPTHENAWLESRVGLMELEECGAKGGCFPFSFLGSGETKLVFLQWKAATAIAEEHEMLQQLKSFRADEWWEQVGCQYPGLCHNCWTPERDLRAN